MAGQEQLSRAGDITINDVTIITSDGHVQTIVPQVAGIDIYEDIFGTFITGKVYLKDSQDIQNLLPLVGEETLRISLKTPTFDDMHSYDMEFFIYRMDDKFQIAERQIACCLHFISKEAIIDVNRRISKGYSGKVSEIVKTILQDDMFGFGTKKPLNIEDTQNDTKYVSNFWTPLQNIQLLCEVAVNQTNSPSYIFFENKHGLNFISLETMYYGTPLYQRFIKSNYSAEMSPGGGSRRDILKDYQTILDIEMSEQFDFFKRLKSGMFGSELITYDILSKQYTHVGYRPNWTEEKHLNEYPMWTKDLPARMKACMINVPKYYNNFENYDDVTNAKIIQKRKSLIARAEGYKVQITVHGRTDYTAGQKVYLEVPKTAQITPEDTDTRNKIVSGNYIIAACLHSITQKTHQCVLELVKDSYTVNINDPK